MLLSGATVVVLAAVLPGLLVALWGPAFDGQERLAARHGGVMEAAWHHWPVTVPCGEPRVAICARVGVSHGRRGGCRSVSGHCDTSHGRSVVVRPEEATAGTGSALSGDGTRRSGCACVCVCVRVCGRADCQRVSVPD